MFVKRYHITEGATTTAGGVVRASSKGMRLNGVPVALEGDAVDCPACAEQGVIKCVTPRLEHRFGVKECALSDDLCICGCNPSPKLIANQTLMSQTLLVVDEDAARAPVRTGAVPAPAPGEQRYDEQTQLQAPQVAGMPYFVQTRDGRTFSGRVGEDGLLPRIETCGVDDYTVLWGDEALASTVPEPVNG
jgi:uncharacterized Zn-binding protein involved in type VI secretion